MNTMTNTSSSSSACTQYISMALLNGRDTPDDEPKTLTIEEAVLFTSTRQPSTRVNLPIDQTEDTSSDLCLEVSHTLSKQPYLPGPTIDLSQHSRKRRPCQILTSNADTLPRPTPPPPITEEYLRSIPPAHRQTIANQRVYALIFNCLERGGGWLWWERYYIDIDAVQRDFGPPSDLSLKTDAPPEMQSADEGAQNTIEIELNGPEEAAQASEDVLGEEEEEIPEAERVRTENNKRLAAYLTRFLMLDRLD